MLNEFALRGVVNSYTKDFDLKISLQLDRAGIDEFIFVYVPHSLHDDFDKLNVEVGDIIQVSGHVRRSPQIMYNTLFVDKLQLVVKQQKDDQLLFDIIHGNERGDKK